MNKWKAKYDVIINAGACAKLDRAKMIDSFVRQLGENVRAEAEQRVNEIYDNFSPEQDEKIIAHYNDAMAKLNEGKENE